MRQIITSTVLGIRLASVVLVIYWVVIFTGTHTPNVRIPSFSNADKVYHFTAFAGLSFLLAWALPKNKLRPWRHLRTALTLAVAYGIFDELTQLLVRGRSAELLDFVADSCGVLTGLLAYTIIRRLILGPVTKQEPHETIAARDNAQPARVTSSAEAA